MEEKGLREAAERKIKSMRKKLKALEDASAEKDVLVRKGPVKSSSFDGEPITGSKSAASDSEDPKSASLNEIRGNRLLNEVKTTDAQEHDMPTESGVGQTSSPSSRNRTIVNESGNTRPSDAQTTPPRDTHSLTSSPVPMQRRPVNSASTTKPPSLQGVPPKGINGGMLSAGNSPLNLRTSPLVSGKKLPSLPFATAPSNAHGQNQALCTATGEGLSNGGHDAVGPARTGLVQQDTAFRNASGGSRDGNATHVGPQKSAAVEFDPLRSNSQEQQSPVGTQADLQVMPSTPVFMVNPQMAVPVVGLATTTSEDSEFLNFPQQVMHVSQPSLASMSIGSNGSFQDFQRQHMYFVQQQGLDNGSSMMTIQQPVFHLQPDMAQAQGNLWTQSPQWLQQSQQQQQHQQQQQPQQAMSHSMPSGHASGQAAPQNGDPFEDIVRQAASSTGTHPSK